MVKLVVMLVEFTFSSMLRTTRESIEVDVMIFVGRPLTLVAVDLEYREKVVALLDIPFDDGGRLRQSEVSLGTTQALSDEIIECLEQEFELEIHDRLKLEANFLGEQ